ncbi:hypothetical protein [Methylobacter sp.]|uniref:hypothetical protein n=1 Tax=Methylobacter sp. TaxID=2051955 RepID=UPI002FDD4269
MKRNKIIEAHSHDKLTEHKKRVAFHEAGHAAGIHLNNKTRQLPPIFFKIIFKDMGGVAETDVMSYQAAHDDCIARVEGGRLIESLPPSIDSLVRELTKHSDAMIQLVNDYMVAFEADIINLLIGPLAEAKYVADTDDELFNRQLVNLNALKNYGGSSDLALANEYLQSFSADEQQRDEKLDELFTVAFDFVNNDVNWAAINKLANYILDDNKNIIGCEEIVSMLDESVDHFQNRRKRARLRQNG